MGIVRWKGSGSGGGTVHFCRRARQARARGANCDSNPLPRGAAEPGARSRPRAPARARRAGVIWNRIAALCNPGWAAARRTGYRLGLGGCFFFFPQPSGEAAGERGRRGGGSGGRAAEERREEEAAAAAARREEARGGRGGEAPARRAARGRAERGPGREGWVGGGLGAREKVTPGRDRSDPRASSTRRRGCAGRPTPAAAGGGGCAGARSAAPAPR